jgi:hypothetical protein
VELEGVLKSILGIWPSISEDEIKKYKTSPAELEKLCHQERQKYLDVSEKWHEDVVIHREVKKLLEAYEWPLAERIFSELDNGEG